MMPTLDRDLALTLLVVTFGLVALALISVLVGSTIVQQRRYLRSRQHLGRRLLEAQDEERAAIARELHDDVVQRLILLTNRLRSDKPARVAAAAELDDVVNALRGLARGIHPAIVDHVGLDDALRELAGSVTAAEALTVEYQRTGTTDRLTPRDRLALYRVAQEALGNAARHAGATTVQMSFKETATGIELMVADGGAGFDVAAASRGPGIGVTSMRERLDLLGGVLTITSAPGAGTRVIATLPRKRGTPG